MGAFVSFVYPLVLCVCGALLLAGLATVVFVRAHRWLEWVVTATYVAVAIQAAWVVYLLVTGTSADLITTVGYLLATLALLPLLGIGRLGHPDAAVEDPDPSRPVLAPDQIARVDGAAAVAVAIALAVASWRLTVLLGGGS